MWRALWIGICGVMFAGLSMAQVVPPDDEIRQILIDRIDVQRQAVGIVIGVIEPKGRRVVAYGKPAVGSSQPLDGDTVFEIGSVGKVFTSLLLADMARRKQVSLEDPLAKYLPADVKVPQRGGKSVTLVDLATHTSGLPLMPSNFAPRDGNNPFADYTVEKLYQFLNNYQLTQDIGSQYEYSNVGAGLLGRALAQRAGMDYGALVIARICDPLQLKSTRVTLTPDLQKRMATGHDLALDPVPLWDLGAIPGAGAFRSSTNDMLTYLAAELGYLKTPLHAAMVDMRTVRRTTRNGAMKIALGWHTFERGGHPMYWHTGMTGGFRSFVGFDPEAGIGIVALANTSTPTGMDDIGPYLLDRRYALAYPIKH
jgi:serine-type D-Ala-D-Ala carboxypeptidase/endopeptidase